MNSPVTVAVGCRASIAMLLMPGTRLVKMRAPRVRSGSAAHKSSSGVGSPADPGM